VQEKLRQVKENTMKKDDLNDELRPEYDLSKLKNQVRGKYIERYREGTNIVLLEPEVSKAFPDSASVNAALRLLINVANKEVRTRSS
jgi:hypothetical protein